MFSADIFYNPVSNKPWNEMGVLAVEMEAAALYMNAAHAKNALCLTISDGITAARSTKPDRQVGFTNMMEIALNWLSVFRCF